MQKVFSSLIHTFSICAIALCGTSIIWVLKTALVNQPLWLGNAGTFVIALCTIYWCWFAMSKWWFPKKLNKIGG